MKKNGTHNQGYFMIGDLCISKVKNKAEAVECTAIEKINIPGLIWKAANQGKFSLTLKTPVSSKAKEILFEKIKGFESRYPEFAVVASEKSTKVTW